MIKKSKFYLKKNIAAIITIRLNSSRLKNKALKKINNLISIQILIKRLKKLNNISNIILATSPHKNLFELRKICEKEKINFFIGSEKKVLKRIILLNKNKKKYNNKLEFAHKRLRRFDYEKNLGLYLKEIKSEMN